MSISSEKPHMSSKSILSNNCPIGYFDILDIGALNEATIKCLYAKVLGFYSDFFLKGNT